MSEIIKFALNEGGGENFFKNVFKHKKRRKKLIRSENARRRKWKKLKEKIRYHGKIDNKNLKNKKKKFPRIHAVKGKISFDLEKFNMASTSN